MAELLIVSVVILAFFVNGNDRFPAYIFCFAAHMQYLMAQFVATTAQQMINGAIIDFILIAALIAVAGCQKSRITYYLIPLSIMSIIIQFFAWASIVKNLPLDDVNAAILGYWCLIFGVFIARIFNGGGRNNRFLRDSRRRNSGLDLLHGARK